ncbi:MAG: type II secretion system F family protein, partial [Lachnospiraceae bacterium]|nr:type II secretion system F family protein [Lachnospiraceae bacterium]
MKKMKKLNNREVAAFCGQLSLLLPAGITPFDGINLMAQDTSSEDGKALLTEIENSLRDGLTLHEALDATKVFPEYVVSMILLGEESGNLDIIMKKLTEYYEQQCVISDSIKNAISYPLIMVCLMLIILAVLLTKILPIFNQVFIQLGSELTGVSKQLMNMGYAIQSVSGILIALLIIIAVIALILYKSPKGRAWSRHFLHTNRFTKGFYLGVAYSRFAGALSMITAGGIDIFKGLELAGRLIDNELMDEKVKACNEVLSGGGYLYEAIKDAGIFRAQHQRMLQIGYRSGNSEVVLDKISKHY